MAFTDVNDDSVRQLMDYKRVKEPKFEPFNFKQYIEKQIGSTKYSKVFKNSLKTLDQSNNSFIGAVKKHQQNEKSSIKYNELDIQELESIQINKVGTEISSFQATSPFIGADIISRGGDMNRSFVSVYSNAKSQASIARYSAQKSYVSNRSPNDEIVMSE